jgi:hypothetical protein
VISSAYQSCEIGLVVSIYVTVSKVMIVGSLGRLDIYFTFQNGVLVGWRTEVVR